VLPNRPALEVDERPIEGDHPNSSSYVRLPVVIDVALENYQTCNDLAAIRRCAISFLDLWFY
jgi:hypothetical protein